MTDTTTAEVCAVAVDGSAIWHNGIRYTPNPTEAELAALRECFATPGVEP
jgi:hypothetical protein